MREYKCKTCGQKPAIKTRKAYFCEECIVHICYECNNKLTPDEQKDSGPKFRGNKVCVDCMRACLARQRDAEVSKLKTIYKLQMRNQLCGKCGKVNDSRDKDGLVTDPFCTKCRQVHKDATAISKSRPKPKFKSDKYFDRVTGVTRKTRSFS